ncbi:MAG: YeiH family protein [Gemmatimonadales bacterium]
MTEPWTLSGARRLLTAAAPGIALTGAVGLAAWLAERALVAALGRAPLEALVLAILLGAALRAAWTPDARFDAGRAVASGLLLECSIVLLGAGADLRQFARVGIVVGAAIVAIVAIALVTGYAVGRAVGLTRTHAMLVACGNAICGNSAIMAVAPVIGAKREEVASAITYTAVLGIVVILGLPHLAPLFALDHYRYGVLAGLTVYAVPQVIAAAYPVSALAGQTATLVKLARVLLLGPLVFALSLLKRRRAGPRTPDARDHPPFVPWFVVGFAAAALLRTGGLIEPAAGDGARDAARLLTLLAMAAVGLGVDLRAVRTVGPKVAAAATGSLLVMIVAALLLVRALPHAG